MSRSTMIRMTIVIWGFLSLVGGCADKHVKLSYLGDTELTHYQDFATQIDYPDVVEEPADELMISRSPRHIGQLSKDEVWELSLAEAIQIALLNNKIIRQNGGVVGSQEGAASVYDSAIQETQPLFGVGSTNTRGIEDALSDFDAQFTTNMLWGRSAEISNSFFSSDGLQNGLALTDETGAFQSRLEKTFANSGVFALRHDWNYSGSNSPSRLFPSVYTGFVRAEYRQPLLAGSGTEFTRIAGPRNQRVGVNRGVIIARINQDITLADFELSATSLLKEVEDTYWDLYLAYQIFHNEMLTRNSVREKWNRIETLRSSGLEQVGILSAEAQARANYFDARGRTESALANIYTTETALRRLLGLPINEGKVIRPKDEPVHVAIETEWQILLAEALTNRVELRKQKWRIKELELELKAAKHLARPSLDLVSNYQVNGFGDNLLASSDRDKVGTQQGLGSAYESITQGEQTAWNLGFEFSWRMGLRSELAQVRNIELRLAKARAFLAAKELDIGHELSLAIQELERSKQLTQTYLNRDIALQEQLDRLGAEEAAPSWQASPEAIDLRLRTDINLKDARIAYFRNLISYNKSLLNVEFRKGTLLEYENVHLSESDWTPEAYEEALRRAWARSHAIDAHHVHPEPKPIAANANVPKEFHSYTDPGSSSNHMLLPDSQSSNPPYSGGPLQDAAQLPPGETGRVSGPTLTITDTVISDESTTFYRSGKFKPEQDFGGVRNSRTERGHEIVPDNSKLSPINETKEPPAPAPRIGKQPTKQESVEWILPLTPGKIREPQQSEKKTKPARRHTQIVSPPVASVPTPRSPVPARAKATSRRSPRRKTEIEIYANGRRVNQSASVSDPGSSDRSTEIKTAPQAIPRTSIRQEHNEQLSTRKSASAARTAPRTTETAPRNTILMKRNDERLLANPR